MECVNFCPYCGYNDLVVTPYTPKFFGMGIVPAFILVDCDKCKWKAAICYLEKNDDPET